MHPVLEQIEKLFIRHADKAYAIPMKKYMKLHFDYEITKRGKVLTTGYTKHVFVTEAGIPVPVPSKVEKLFG